MNSSKGRFSGITQWLKEEKLDLLEAYLWIVLAIPTLIWWKESVLWVAIMSIYANAKTSHGAYKAELARKEASGK